MLTGCRIYTCTPVAFHANDAFFCRDTGLISRTLRSLGAESKTIMPLPWHGDDQPEHIIRTAPAHLRSPRWWRALGIDALMLYSWGDPRYTPIARAIHQAGIRFAIQLDFNGAFLPTDKFPRFLRQCIIDKLRALHLSYADAISTSPRGAEYLRHARPYGPLFADKCLPLITPIAPCFQYGGATKTPRIICVGNWQEDVKRPIFLMATLGQFLNLHPLAAIDICGPTTPGMRQWHGNLPTEAAARVILHGAVAHEKLPELYNAAQISLCTSASEGTHNASGEALCCGCSIVTTNRPDRLPMVHWYTTRHSGRIADSDTPGAVAQALCDELQAWQQGERNPAAISAAWSPLFRADHALSAIFSELLAPRP